MDRRISKTRQAIQAAYFSLLAKKDGKITISDIARDANVDRKTFYLHYETMDDIVREFSEAKVKEFMQLLEDNNFFTASSRTDTFFNCLNSLLSKDLAFYRHIVRNVNHSIFWSQVHQCLVDTIVALYRERTGEELMGIRVAAEFYVSGYLTIYQNWMREENPIPLEELSAIAAHITNYGIRDLPSAPAPEFTPGGEKFGDKQG